MSKCQDARVREDDAAFGSGLAATTSSLGKIGNAREEKNEAGYEKEKQGGKSQSGVARAPHLSLEGWPSARTLHGRDRGISPSEASAIRRTLAAHRRAVAGALTDC